jgi:phosphatidylethanolamine/phosphatidyl-N-methylethanolamine N-methyltransferase
MNNRQSNERKFWDKFASHYDSFIRNVVGKTYKSILENMDSELNANQAVLEIGTGTGIIPFVIFSKVSSIVATDISPDMIKIAAQKQADLNIRNIDFQVQDSYNLAFPDKSFGVVIASNLLHLLYEPEKPLAEVMRVMKDDGIFIAPTFCVGENRKSKVITTVAGIISGFKIINNWSIREFKIMLLNNGFKEIKVVRIDGRFPLVYVVLTK